MRTGPLKMQFITFRRPKPPTRGSSLADMPRKRSGPCGTRNKKSSRETSGTPRTIGKYWRLEILAHRDFAAHISIEPRDSTFERVDLVFSLIKAVPFARIDFAINRLARVVEETTILEPA